MCAQSCKSVDGNQQEINDDVVEGTRQVHFNWQAKVWRYMSHDCEEDEFQEEDTEEIICGQRVVNSRARLHLLEGKIKFARAIFITCQKWTFLRGPHVNSFFGLQLFSHFFGAQSPIKGEEIDFSRGIHQKKVEMEVRVVEW